MIFRNGKKDKIALGLLAVLGIIMLLVILLWGSNFAVLNPKGVVAHKQRGLLIFGSLLSLIVIVPVYVLTFFIVWKYRASNKKAKYTPDWDHHRVLEAVWWGVPTLLILILSIVTWRSSHALDPRRPLASDKPAMTIQVVALQWKWLFIYPAQGVASVNYAMFPVGTPVNFEITADAPMNSFWIPQLGGQIYAMSGMATHLQLEADSAGSYRGSSANISGEGFAGMHFIAQAGTANEFSAWVDSVKQAQPLGLESYKQLAAPSIDNRPAFYTLSDTSLFSEVIAKYTAPSQGQPYAEPVHDHGGY